MTRQLKNANITHVSYVDKGANKKKFFLTKSEEEPAFQKEVRVLVKSDDDQMLVYGIVYEPNVEDAHGDFMEAEDIEKAAHTFLKEARNIDKQHDFQSGYGEVVESYVAPQDFEIGGDTIAKGSWVLVTKATEEVWKDIQEGKITGYSMAGTADVIEVEKEEDQEEFAKEETQMKSFFKTLKDFFTGEDIIKGAVRDTFYEGKKRREFFDALYIFEDFFYNEVWSSEPDVDAIKQHAIDFADLLIEIANSPDVLKALGEVKKREVLDMTKEELQEVLAKTLEPINSRLEQLEVAKEEVVAEEVTTEETPAETPEEVVVEKGLTKEELSEVLTKALEPINSRLAKVEKARGLSKASNEEVVKTEEDKDQSIWKGLF